MEGGWKWWRTAQGYVSTSSPNPWSQVFLIRLTPAGDGAFFCDMDGSGNDDYIWAAPDGKLTILRNPNIPPATDYAWDEKTSILDTGADRKALRFADMDGDGKCDVVAVTKDTGALDVWYTSYDKSAKKFSFSSKTRIDGSGTSKGPNCSQGWGVGVADLGLRLADIE